MDGSDLDTEIQLMAMQSGENPRRLRARLIKSGMIENLEAQVRERKSIEVILEHAEFNDVEGEPLVRDPVATIDQSVCHSSSDTAAETVDEPAADTAAEDAGEESATQDETSDETGDETVKEAEADGEADEDE